MKVFTKILCALLSVVMVFTALAVIADVPPLAITKQPTYESPSVSANATEDVTYQWYVSAGKEQGVLSSRDVKAINYDSELTPDRSYYDNNTGKWTPSCYEGVGEYFTIDLKAGESIRVVVSDFVYEIGLINPILIDDYSGVENADGSYTITVDADATYHCYAFADNIEEVTLIAYGETYFYEKLVGENKKKLSNVEYGKRYYCLVSRGAEEIKSDIVAGEYVVTQQPSIKNPSVKVTYSHSVQSYQWYKYGKDNIEITDKTENVKKFGSYDNASSSWIPYVIYEGSGDSVMWVLSKYFEKGDIVTVNLEGEGVTSVWLSNVDEGFSESAYIENGQTVIELSHNGNYTIVVESASTDIKVKVSAYTNTDILLDGETDKAIQNTAFGEIYRCKITYKNGINIWSDRYENTYGIIKQPTAADSSVTVSFAERVASYQWGTAHIGNILVTDKNAIPATEIHGSSEGTEKSTFDASTGLWTPVVQSQITNSEPGIVPNRIYFCNINETYKEVNAFFFNSNNTLAAWPGLPMNQIEDTCYWYIDVPEGYKAVIFNDYNNTGAQSHDLYLSDFQNEGNCYVDGGDYFYDYQETVTTTISQLGLFDIVLKKGETITFEFNGPIYENIVWNGLAESIEMDENGQYKFTAEKDTPCSFYVNKCFEEPLTVKVTLENTDVFTPIEGATKRVFAAAEENTYACVITYKDGTILKSDKVLLERSPLLDMDGDINGDGSFDMFDYFLIKSIYFEIFEPTDIELERADVNGDGFVDAFDYLAIKTLFFL